MPIILSICFGFCIFYVLWVIDWSSSALLTNIRLKAFSSILLLTTMLVRHMASQLPKGMLGKLSKQMQTRAFHDQIHVLLSFFSVPKWSLPKL
jgi:hypothetical protein